MSPPQYTVGYHVQFYGKPLGGVYAKNSNFECESTTLSSIWHQQINRRNAIRLDLPSYVQTHSVINVSYSQPATASQLQRKPTSVQEVLPVRAKQQDLDGIREEVFQVHKILSQWQWGQNSQFLTLQKNRPQHHAKWWPIPDFGDEDGTTIEATWDYIRTQ